MFDPARHQKIEDSVFDQDKVIDTIRKIIDGTLNGSLLQKALWPIHPKDRFDGCPEFRTDFYMGAAGVVWALDQLTLKNENNLKDYIKDKIDQILSTHLTGESSHYADRGSYFVGEAGVRAVKEKFNPSLENQSVLKALIESKLDSAQNELLYGLPGTLLISHFNSNVETKKLNEEIILRLLSTREIDPLSGAKIWAQNFGTKMYFLGAAHGTVGNSGILLRALEPSEKDKRLDIIINLEKLLTTYAKIEEGFCNWPARLSAGPDAKFLVHWCHGATGVVTELATNIGKDESEIISNLLLKAGALIWKAGALEKGTSLCHGTAGSGMAMLKMYERTKDSQWLHCAQAFAMHSIHQHEAEVASSGQLRYSLWTGDLGLALFLKDTLAATSSMPGIDIF